MPKRQEFMPKPAARRGLGIDTTHAAFGVLAQGDNDNDATPVNTRLSEEHFQRICRQVVKLKSKCSGRPDDAGHAFSWDVASHARHGHAHLLDYDARFTNGGKGETEGSPIEALTAVIGITLSTGHRTMITIEMRHDTNRSCWMNIRANPTALALGYNAYALAIDKKGTAAKERAMLLKLPFVVVGSLLASIGTGGFKWPQAVRRRIAKLLFKPVPVQLFTYGPIEPAKKSWMLGLVRALLSCPCRTPQGDYVLLADLLGIEVHAVVVDGRVQSLLLRIFQDGGQFLSVNLYDKLVKALQDAAAAGNALSDEGTAFLSNHMRIDMTLNKGAAAAVMGDAGVGKRTTVALTGLNLNKAITNLNLSKGSTARHLLKYIFEDMIPIMKLARYEPDLLDKAAAALAKHDANAAAGFKEWLALGFALKTEDGRRVSFLQFLQSRAKKKVSEQVARTARAKVLAAGLDPDIPLAAYQVFFNQRHIMGLAPDQLDAMNRAIDKGDAQSILALMRESGKTVGKDTADLGKIMSKMIAGAHVPAVLLVPVEDDDDSKG